ncbi:MAG: hypothetical protein PWR03_2283 [Tenuifilum sp.]|jgi:hypothetical protein|nr:hypothetical protein [Tenuifilum sp.]
MYLSNNIEDDIYIPINQLYKDLTFCGINKFNTK